jgi:hypothetical protein
MFIIIIVRLFEIKNQFYFSLYRMEYINIKIESLCKETKNNKHQPINKYQPTNIQYTRW